MIYMRVDFERFCGLFRVEQRDSQFSYAGLLALFNYLEEYYGDSVNLGESYEVDAIGLCSEWTEYPSVKSLLEDRLLEYSSDESLHEEGMSLLREDHVILNLHNGKGFLFGE